MIPIQNQIDPIELWISTLSGFISTATRYPINLVHNGVSKGHEFSLILEDYVLSGSTHFIQFKRELRKKLSQSVNPDIILLDVKDEFDSMIRIYKKWFEKNEEETKIFGQYNPYSLMLNYVLFTEKEIQKYSSKSKPGQKVKTNSKLTFNKIFRPEHRTHIPDEVIRLLGMGEADAWEMKNNKKEWVFKDPESAIMIPFYYLCELKFIEIPPRKKKEFISIWLKEFGKEYKPKTFYKPPQDYEATEHFKDYLNKLK
jgi:hypothetical protein